MKRLALFSVCALALSACLGSDFADSVEGTWRMTSGTVDGEEIPFVASHPITIAFDNGEVRGTASCNGYSGSYELSGSEITFGNLSMTEMACFPEETMAAEAAYAAAIPRVETIAIDTQLTLTGEDVELVFVSE